MRYGVKEARAAKNMTQRELAERSGVSRATIIKLEGGGPARPARLRTLQRIAAALGDDLSRILVLGPEAGGHGNENKEGEKGWEQCSRR